MALLASEPIEIEARSEVHVLLSHETNVFLFSVGVFETFLCFSQSQSKYLICLFLACFETCKIEFTFRVDQNRKSCGRQS
jgi:hypothetical protein